MEKNSIETELKRIYQEVLKSFPDVKEEELKLNYIPDLNDYIIFSPFEGSTESYRPTLVIGRLLSELNNKEKEAVMAHEIGHYLRTKNYSMKRIVRAMNRYEKIQFYTEENITNEQFKHNVERLQKFFFMFENYADSKAIEAGYGEHVLSALKKTYNNHNKSFPAMSKRNICQRIKNLEEKIFGDKKI